MDTHQPSNSLQPVSSGSHQGPNIRIEYTFSETNNELIFASINLTEVNKPKEKERAAKGPRPDDETEECGETVDLSAVIPVIDLSCAPITKETKVILA